MLFPLMGQERNRGVEIRTIDLCVRAAKQRAALCFLLIGSEPRKERLGVIEVFHQIREAQPDVSRYNS